MRHGPSKPYWKYTEEQKQGKRRVVRLYAQAHKKERAAYMKFYMAVATEETECPQSGGMTVHH